MCIYLVVFGDKRYLEDNKKPIESNRSVSVVLETFSLIKCVDIARPRRHWEISAAHSFAPRIIDLCTLHY